MRRKEEKLSTFQSSVCAQGIEGPLLHLKTRLSFWGEGKKDGGENSRSFGNGFRK